MSNSITKRLNLAILIIAIFAGLYSLLSLKPLHFVPGLFIIHRWIFPIIVLLGWIWFLMNISKWAVDEKAKNNLRIASILAIIGIILMWLTIPYVGWIVKALFLITFILMLLGYGNVNGGKLARVASVVLLIAAILSFIPTFIFWVVPLVYLAGWIILIIGWCNISKAN